MFITTTDRNLHETIMLNDGIIVELFELLQNRSTRFVPITAHASDRSWGGGERGGTHKETSKLKLTSWFWIW